MTVQHLYRTNTNDYQNMLDATSTLSTNHALSFTLILTCR